jgi:hypothetical protein
MFLSFIHIRSELVFEASDCFQKKIAYAKFSQMSSKTLKEVSCKSNNARLTHLVRIYPVRVIMLEPQHLFQMLWF